MESPRRALECGTGAAFERLAGSYGSLEVGEVILKGCDPSDQQAIVLDNASDNGFERYHAPGVGDAHRREF
jgi:hypothetical protein